MRHLITVLILIFAVSSAYAQEKKPSLDDELIYRINFGSAEDIKILLDKGANPNAIGQTGDHALDIAISRDDEESAPIVKLLLDKGANASLPDKSGLYPIVNAVLNNKAAIVKYLLEAGADYHVKSSNGRTLVEIAKQNKNEDIAKMIQDRLDKEIKPVDRSPERFKQLVHQYVFYSCAYQYWSFVLSSRQDPDKDADTNKQIDAIKTELMNTVQQLQSGFPNTPQGDLKAVADNAAQQIYSTLNDMISNRNRKSQGVGQKDDATKRCQTLSDTVKIDFAPSVMSGSSPR